MLSLTILNSVAFGLYGLCKDLVKEKGPKTPAADALQFYIAGAGVGLLSSPISTPFEVVKVRMQHASGKQYTGSTDAALKLVRAHGITALYTGHVINTWREILFCTVYFGGYENLKNLFTQSLADAGTPNPQLAILFAGGFAGMLGWFFSYPLDVIKNLKQTQPLDGSWWSRGASSWSLTTQRFLELGLSGFYRGIRPSLLRAFFVSGTRFSAYEFACRMWKWYEAHPTETLLLRASSEEETSDS